MKSIGNAQIHLIHLNILLYFFAIVSAQSRQEKPINASDSGRWTVAPNITTDEQARKNIDDEDTCLMPPKSLDKTITYNCTSKQCDTKSVNVPRFTVASITCKPNYYPEINASSPSISTCLDKKWIPPIQDCFKKCENLKPSNVNVRCIRNGMELPCNENSLIAGTKVRSTCKPFYRYEIVPNYNEITCEEDGKWDRILFPCDPECGLKYTNATHVFDHPWHVAIYNSSKVLICSGTIISSHLVLTAAHCFQKNEIPANNTSDYEVVTTKMTRNYNTKDNENQKSFKIKEIQLSPKPYMGSIIQHRSNIALLILEEKINFSEAVRPACVYRISLEVKSYSPLDGASAQVSEWRANERGVVSEKLTTTEVQFANQRSCVYMVPDGFIKSSIAFDHFCATIKDGMTGFRLTQENGGSGLIFLENSLYTLRGIVSLQQPPYPVALFTDLDSHMDWIYEVHTQIEWYGISTVKKNLPGNLCSYPKFLVPQLLQFHQS